MLKQIPYPKNCYLNISSHYLPFHTYYFLKKNIKMETNISMHSYNIRKKCTSVMPNTLTSSVTIPISKLLRTFRLGRITLKKTVIGWNIQDLSLSSTSAKTSQSNNGSNTVLKKRYNPGTAQKYGTCATNQ